MSQKLKTYGIMIIAAVLLVAMAFAGAASADGNWTDAGNFNASWYEAEGGDSATTYHIYDAPSLAALSEKVTMNATTYDFKGKTIAIMNDINLAGHAWNPIGNESLSFNGNLTGNYHTISNFNIDGGSSGKIGLIGNYDGTSIKNLTISNFSVHGGADLVGGLVGRSGGTDTIENVKAEFGNVTSSANCVGGVFGGAVYMTFKNCTVINCIVSSSGMSVGGLIGWVNELGSFDECTVLNCSISAGSGNAGGIAGQINGNGSPFMHACNVVNCIISSRAEVTGSLVGNIGNWDSDSVNVCNVENCTIAAVSTDGLCVGGLIGLTLSDNPIFENSSGKSTLNWCAIRGDNTSTVAKIVGCYGDDNKKFEEDEYNVTITNVWLNNHTSVQTYPKIIIAKSADKAKQGPEKSEYFNEGNFGEPTGLNAKIITRLSGYGDGGKYEAIAYVYESAPEYPIYITTSSGTKQLTGDLMSVTGDEGQGTATLTQVGSGDNPWVLTLTNFNATNTGHNDKPIINASVPNLTIKLVGDSNLTGSFANKDMGLVYSSGNLMITDGGNDNGKLLVNNTASGSGNVYAINAVDNLIVDGAHLVTAVAESTGSVFVYALKSYKIVINASTVQATACTTDSYSFPYAISSDNSEIIISGNSDVTATATVAKANEGAKSYAIDAHNGNIEIDASNVTAIANTTNGWAMALHSSVNVFITGNSYVTATAEATSGTEAYAIYPQEGVIEINASNVTAIANTTNGFASAVYPAFGALISGNSDVTAIAESINVANVSAIEAYDEDVTIDASTVTAIANTTNGNYAKALCADDDVIISGGSDVTAKAKGNSGVKAIRAGKSEGPYYSYKGNLTIISATVKAFAHSTEGTANALSAFVDFSIRGDDTIIETNAESRDGLAFPIYAGNNLTIASANKITAIGTANPGNATSFAYNLSWIPPAEEPMIGTGSLNIDALANGYTFSNATASAGGPNSYAEFADPSKWHDIQFIVDDLGKVLSYPSSNYTAVIIEKKSTPTPTPYTPSSRQSGQTQIIQQQVQDVSADPTPANQQTADISVKYHAQTVIGTSTADTAALKQQYPEAAAQFEVAFANAQAAGIPLTNSKGAKAVVMTSENIPNVEKVTFSRVYEISPANEGEKLTKVTVKVPKSDITSKGLTSEDVTIYHYLDTYNIWVPLETLSVSQDDTNYYYTAATDGTSPFGVLVKKIDDDSTASSTTQPTQSSPAPVAGLMAGLGVAGILLRMRR